VPHDPLDLAHVLRDELAQRRASGYDVGGVEAEVARALDGGTSSAVLRALWRVEQTKHSPGWRYSEPSTWDEIHGQLPPSPDLPRPRLDRWGLQDRLGAAWLGRAAGQRLGTPTRGWSHRQIPLDYTLLGLGLLETYGFGFDTVQVARQWMEHLPVLRTHTAERAAYRNLMLGLGPPATAAWRNPYREWVGAQVRADIWGYVSPGNPAQAAALAFRDARLSHTGNGIFGELWVAALLACAFVTNDVVAAIRAALGQVPARSRLAEAVREQLSLHAEGSGWAAAHERTRERLAGYHWMHVIGNAAVVAAALLWGDGDFERTIGLAVQAGWDTDCNGATVGSVLGAMHGSSVLPARALAPLGGRIAGAVVGPGPSPVEELAERTCALALGEVAH
jgi:ADP-ribosylglycohydrolase